MLSHFHNNILAKFSEILGDLLEEERSEIGKRLMNQKRRVNEGIKDEDENSFNMGDHRQGGEAREAAYEEITCARAKFEPTPRFLNGTPSAVKWV